MKETIIFDIDDTVGNLRIRLQEIYRKATGDQTIKYTDWDDYGVKSRYGISSDELTQLFLQDNSLQLMEPHDGIIEVSAILKARGYNIEFVTARGWHPDGFAVTKKWLEDYNITYDRINIVPLFECKEQVTRHIENIKLFVDDRFDHCQSMLNSGRVEACLLYNQPWNQTYQKNAPEGEKIHTIHSIYDVLKYAPGN